MGSSAKRKKDSLGTCAFSGKMPGTEYPGPLEMQLIHFNRQSKEFSRQAK